MEVRGLIIDMVLATDMSSHFEQLKQMRLLLSEPDRYQIILLLGVSKTGSLCRDGSDTPILYINTLLSILGSDIGKPVYLYMFNVMTTYYYLLLHDTETVYRYYHIIVMTFHFIVYHTTPNRPKHLTTCVYNLHTLCVYLLFQYISVIGRVSLQGPLPATAHSRHLSSGQAVGYTHTLDH